MSYQIKSTPYFQRMLTKSKRNGELQRLKEEYERIKDFSDHTIAMRIRQVRLRSLFREIRDINATSAFTRPRRPPPKSYAQQRAEELTRARELGTEYSRENAMNIQRYGPYSQYSSMSMPTPRAILEKKASNTARRIMYGNNISAFNLKRFQKLRNSSITQTTSTHNNLSFVSSSMEVDKMEKLRNRINYGNSCSTVNISGKHNNSKAGSTCKSYRAAGARETQTSNTKLMPTEKQYPIDEVRRNDDVDDDDMVNNYTFVLEDADDGDNNNYNSNNNYDETAAQVLQVNQDVDDDEDAQYLPISMILKNDLPQLFKRLNKSNVLRARIREAAKNRRYQENQEIQEEDFDSVPDESEEEFVLRKIDNDRNIPLSRFRKAVLPTTVDSLDDAQLIENEELIKVSKLNENDSSDREELSENVEEIYAEREKYKDQPAFEQLTPKDFFAERTHTRSLKNKPLPNPDYQVQKKQAPSLNLHDKVQDFVKLYEPFPRGHNEQDTTVKDNYESGVAKLRSIFEHQGE